MSGGVYVQYGAGFSAPEGWQSFDASPSLIVERMPLVGRYFRVNAQRFPEAIRRGDIIRGLPVADGSAAGVYASHVLEHLTRADCITAIRNTFRMLRPGGVFRLIVPDLEIRARRYVAMVAAGDSSASPYLMRSTLLGQEARRRGVRALREQLGHSAHRWMWDFPSIAHELAAAGFVAIRRCAFNDADDPMFARVEEPSRFSTPDGPELAVEARRGPR